MKSFIKTLIQYKKPVFIVGSKKNAGKTTMLVRLLDEFHNLSVPTAFFSTGRDGESFDSVFGHKKPQIYVQNNDIFVTNENSIFAEVKLIDVFDSKTSGSQEYLAIWEAKSSGRVELNGASTVKEVWMIIKSLQTKYEYPILIDGAFDRWSALGGGDCAFISVINIDAGFLSETELNFLKFQYDKINLNINKQNLPIFTHMDLTKNIKNLPDQIIFNGALTSTILKQFLQKNKNITITLPSPTHCFLSQQDFYQYQNILTIQKSPTMLAIAVNSFGNSQNITKTIQKILPNIPILLPVKPIS